MIFQLLLFLCLALSSPAFGKDLRIVGGVGTDAREFPYMASLRYIGQNKHICAGTIITDKHILSVAHCIYEMEIYYGFLLVYLGISNMLDESGSIFHVTKLHIHPNYIGEKTGKNGFHNDIAIYTLHRSIEFNAVQNKIELPTTDISSGSSVTISGWGLTSFPSDQPPNQIQKATVKVLEYSKCAEIFDFRILNDQICTYEEGMGICTGDSGGPVTKNGKLVGIISFALPCAKGIPDIHTNVYTHLDFIHSIIDN